MSFWDNVKKFAQPYADDEYDDYDEDDDYADDYEEPAEQPARRAPRRTPAPAPAPAPEEEDDYGFSPMPASNISSGVASSGFNGQVLNMNSAASNKQEVVLFRPSSFNDTSKAADDLRNHKAVIVNMENVDKAMARPQYGHCRRSGNPPGRSRELYLIRFASDVPAPCPTSGQYEIRIGRRTQIHVYTAAN